MSIQSTNKVDNNTYELTLSVNAEMFENAVQAAYMKARKNIAIPGFRKGKAPRKMVEKMYGESVFFEDAVNNIIPTVVQEAVDSEKLELVDRPSVEVVSVNKDDGVIFKAVCIVKPEVSIENYKGAQITRKLKEIDDADINKAVDDLRQRNARMVTVDDRSAQIGDVVNIDFIGTLNGEPFDGGADEGFDLELGSGQFISGFEDQIVGHSGGEAFDVNVTFPEDYPAKNLVGQAVVFAVTLHEIKQKELPDVDDDFVKDTTEFETVEQFKADVKEKLSSQATKNADADVEEQIRNVVIQNVKADVPAVMFEQRVQALVQDFARRLSQQGLNMDVYMRYTGLTMDKFKADCEARAHDEVMLRLGMEAIAAKEDILVSDEEINEHLDDIARANNIDDVQKIRDAISMEEFIKDIKISKTIDIVRDSAVITTVSGDAADDSSDDSQTQE